MNNLFRLPSGYKIQIQIYITNVQLYSTLLYTLLSKYHTYVYIYEYNQKIISFTILYSAKTLNKVFCMNTNDTIRTYININFVIVTYME